MYGVLVKPGVVFGHPAKAGFRILSAIEQTARRLAVDLTITCATEAHPPDDPHATGEAYDVRTHGLDDDQKRAVLREIMAELSEPSNAFDAPIPMSGGLATGHFFGWIEHPGADNEHLHVQRRKATVYA